MSRSYEYSYELEARRREKIYNARVSKTTEKFYNKYKKQYNQMKEKGYAAYIPEEMKRLKSDLDRIRKLLVKDPTKARELSYSVGVYIRSMSSLVEAAVEQFDRAERMRVEKIREEKEAQQNELLQLYFELLKEISNPIVVNFTVSDLKGLRQEIESGKIQSKDAVKKSVADITAEAEVKAEKWKKHTISSNKKKDVSDKLAEAEDRIQSEKIENQEKTAEFIEKIRRLRQAIDSGTTDYSEVENQISQIEKEVDDTLITEEVRRETVKSIINQLRSQEFTVERPQVIQTDGKSYVKIVALRPSGKRAVCNVDLHGKIAYKFDNYEGMTCLKDIERFNIDLEQIYSVKLSDERVLWSNPDRLSVDAKPMPRNDRRNA